MEEHGLLPVGLVDCKHKDTFAPLAETVLAGLDDHGFHILGHGWSGHAQID